MSLQPSSERYILDHPDQLSLVQVRWDSHNVHSGALYVRHLVPLCPRYQTTSKTGLSSYAVDERTNVRRLGLLIGLESPGEDRDVLPRESLRRLS